eukprot:scaffold54_cov110-Cylindrotheca_fusiformis.AAC.11
MNNSKKKQPPQQQDLSATTITSVKAALMANRQLQDQLKRELARILERQQQNRMAAASCLKQLQNTTLQQNAQQEEEDSLAKGNNKSKKSPTVAQIMALIPENPPITLKRRQTFRYDPNRKWQLSYWTDPTGSIPEPNDDTIKRQRQRRRQTMEPHLSTTKTTTTATRPFTKEESKFILKEQKEQQQPNPDWQNIAAQLNDRTAFECLQHYYHKKKKKRGPEMPTQEEEEQQQQQQVDDTLLYYLALQGPQFVWDLPSSAHSAPLIGGGKYTHKQLRIKANTTQTVNPNYTRPPSKLKHFWSIDEQRKLVLAMKVYSAADSNNNNNNYPSPVQLAAMHFPHRPTSYVTKKWERTLNPQRRIPNSTSSNNAIAITNRKKQHQQQQQQEQQEDPSEEEE